MEEGTHASQMGTPTPEQGATRSALLHQYPVVKALTKGRANRTSMETSRPRGEPTTIGEAGMMDPPPTHLKKFLKKKILEPSPQQQSAALMKWPSLE